MCFSMLHKKKSTAKTFVLLLGVLLVSLSDFVQASIVVGFDRNRYDIAPGDTAEVRVMFDMDDQQPGFQPLTESLFSMGVVVNFPADRAEVNNEMSVVVPAPLNNNGFGLPAEKKIGEGFAGATGTVLEFAGYQSSLLLTVALHDLTPVDAAPLSYQLTLDFFQRPFANFVDFTGKDIDNQITFQSATINVIPEPASYMFFTLVALLVSTYRRSWWTMHFHF